MLRVRKEKVVALIRTGKLEKVDTGGRHPRFRVADVLSLMHTGFGPPPKIKRQKFAPPPESYEAMVRRMASMPRPRAAS